MSELKAIQILINGQEIDFYFKDEADKVIARHKYKRCLANAEMCMHKRWRPDEGFDYARSTRHMNKWLEIAEQFKPNNSTAQ